MNVEELSLKEKETLLLFLNKGSTVEEILREKSIRYAELHAIMRKLLKHKFIFRAEGYPTRYRVGEQDREELEQLAERLDWKELEQGNDVCKLN